jgi:S-adenosylmethionine:tRNA ribosyltransferase-isomerase
MKKQELQFLFPETLIATEPAKVSRIFSALSEFKEIGMSHLFNEFQEGDLLIINDTKVLPRRIFSLPEKNKSTEALSSTEFFGLTGATNTANGSRTANVVNNDSLEILFLSSEDQMCWNVLFPAKRTKLGDKIKLPGSVEICLNEKGLPQKVKSNIPLDESYFEKFGDVPIPPYIQKVRQERKSKPQDKNWYQTHWAKFGGSFAAPTASLHFKHQHLAELQQRGVSIEKVTLHVGMGTFLPVHTEDLKDHKMHQEQVFIAAKVWDLIQETKKKDRKVWALGTTVARALESIPQNKLSQNEKGFVGSTDLLILPGFQFEVVDRLLTNFHQPESTLLALVYAFAGSEKVKTGYRWAIENQFRLFSYGDLSLWKRA